MADDGEADSRPGAGVGQDEPKPAKKPTTKKRGRKRFRVKRVLAEEDSDDGDAKTTTTTPDGAASSTDPVAVAAKAAGLSQVEVLAALKEEQKARARRRGLTAEAMNDVKKKKKKKHRTGGDGEGDDGGAEDEAAAAAAEANQKGGILVPSKAERAAKVAKLIDGGFAAEKGEVGLDTNRHMEEYIRQRMGKPEGLDADDLLASDGEGGRDGEGEDAVVKAADAVLNQPRAPKVKPMLVSTGQRDDDDALEGAPIPFQTGLAEVSLPMSFREKNIERTEAARRAAMAAAEVPHDHSSKTGVVGNMTYNYHQHRAQYAAVRRGPGGRGGPGGGGGPRMPQPPEVAAAAVAEAMARPSHSSAVPRESGHVAMGRGATDDAALRRFRSAMLRKR